MTELRNGYEKNLEMKEDFELEYYSKILDFFQNQKISPEKLELWKYKFLMKLMDELKFTGNKMLVKNALIIITSLFENVPPDMLNSRGNDSKQLSNKDREIYNVLLKSELLLN